MYRKEYTALASSDEADEAAVPDQYEDWRLIKDCNDGTLPNGPSFSQQGLQENSSPKIPSATAEGSHIDNVKAEAQNTSETTPDRANDQPNEEPAEGWNTYLRKGAVAAVGGTMIPLPTPFGAVIASSGLAVLGTEFEGAKEMNDTLISTTQDKLERVRFRVEEKLSKSDTPNFLSRTFLPLVKRRPSQSEPPNVDRAEASNSVSSNKPADESMIHETSEHVTVDSDSSDFTNEKKTADNPIDEPE